MTDLAKSKTEPNASSHERYVTDLMAELNSGWGRLNEIRRVVAAIDTGSDGADHAVDRADRCLQRAEALMSRLTYDIPADFHDHADAIEGLVEDARYFMALAESDIETRTATEPVDYRVNATRQIAAWQAVVDRATVQAHLGQMDAKDQLDEIRRRLSAQGRHLRHDVVDEPVDKLRTAFQAALADVRDLFGTLAVENDDG